MKATFTPEQRDIQESIRSIAKEEKTTAREALAREWRAPGCDAVLLGDFGLLGVPESAGGMGSSLVDLLVAVEVLGEHLVPSRFPAHAAAVQLAVGLGALPEDVLEGRTVLTPAVDVPGRHGWPGRGAADPLVRTLVPYAVQADRVVALDADGVWIAEPADITPRESFDPSMPLSDVTLAVPSDAAPAGPGAGRAALVAAAELCGVAGGAIGLAAEYARTRQQFGRVIGSFQGVAFQLADAVTRRKAAWDLTLYAAWAVDKGRPEAEGLVHAAKGAAGQAAVFAAERCIQVHGGMGITMEADPHLFLRRAHVLDAWLGRGRWHRRRVGELQVQRRREAQGGA
ncbi:alkylation response protein AidB-like acyl-CoA dehydrogenase [Actinomadura hallensis]|uniref:Alkylation response protein AidB-like acyl-CoA dehydrogenase n=1 Tax=Actinomadura hallensis TaxID=337895 RepID=A0A543IGG9_9ACTN|nr:acyl-CoA dehydrogenase [Actinomadura hallensis]TQM69685.1 alkylation response protein AidB-like acyl-CoA dehydrogenase [Actinomadura hallensis]